jgi:hypothetical protein
MISQSLRTLVLCFLMLSLGAGCPEDEEDNDNSNGNVNVSGQICPESLRLVGGYMTGPENATEADGLAVVGTTVYVASADGLWIIDASDPAQPALLAHEQSVGPSYEVLVSGGIAYVGHAHGTVTLFEVSTPSAPQELGSVELIDAWGDPQDFRLEGSRLYVAAWNNGFSVVDVSNTSAPEELGHASPLTASYGISVEPGGQYAYIARDLGGVTTYDLTDLSDITEVDTTQTPGAAAALVRHQQYLYAACGLGGLAVVDVSTPTALTHTALTVDYDSVDDVFLSGTYLYVGDALFGVRILDISNALEPVAVGSLASGQDSGRLNHVVAAGASVYTTTRWHGLSIYSIACE